MLNAKKRDATSQAQQPDGLAAEVDPVWWTVCRLGRLGFREHLRLVSDWG